MRVIIVPNIYKARDISILMLMNTNLKNHILTFLSAAPVSREVRKLAYAAAFRALRKEAG